MESEIGTNLANRFEKIVARKEGMCSFVVVSLCGELKRCH